MRRKREQQFSALKKNNKLQFEVNYGVEKKNATKKKKSKDKSIESSPINATPKSITSETKKLQLTEITQLQNHKFDS